jgi:GntR family transcriptional regulator
MQLRRNSVVPLYRQMEAALLQRIEAGELRPGERLPPESELARQWQVNRLTVRQAIGELARAGRVTVRRGAGTYVVEPPLLVAVDLPQLPTTEAEAASSELLAAQGQQLHEVVIHIGGDGRPAAVEALGVSDLTRIDTVTESPVGTWQISSYWVPRDRFPTLTAAVIGSASVYRTYASSTGRGCAIAGRRSWRRPPPARTPKCSTSRPRSHHAPRGAQRRRFGPTHPVPQQAHAGRPNQVRPTLRHHVVIAAANAWTIVSGREVLSERSALSARRVEVHGVVHLTGQVSEPNGHRAGGAVDGDLAEELVAGGR